jgi:hypothetical protein
MKNVIQLVEEDQKHNNTRETYQAINRLKKWYQHKFNTISNKKRRIGNKHKKWLHTGDQKELIKTGNEEISEVEVE